MRKGRVKRELGGRYRHLGSLAGDAAMQTASANGQAKHGAFPFRLRSNLERSREPEHPCEFP